MRQQGQQNRRGRNRGGRKVQNPLTRNYDSSGPDVKIRGTASHIAEKYTSLARDALSSGDTVAAENFFQHAEHYNRIIMSAQQQGQSDAQPVIVDQPNLNGSSPAMDAADSHLQTVDDNSSDDVSGEKKNGRQRGRSAKSNGAANNRRKRRRPNGNGSNPKNGADASSDSGPSGEHIPAAKKDSAGDAEASPSNGALL